jgi:hypothetical protein
MEGSIANKGEAENCKELASVITLFLYLNKCNITNYIYIY